MSSVRTRLGSLAKTVMGTKDRSKTKAAIAIRTQGVTMNRDEWKYNLSHVFDDLLVDKLQIPSHSCSQLMIF